MTQIEDKQMVVEVEKTTEVKVEDNDEMMLFGDATAGYPSQKKIKEEQAQQLKG